MIADCINCLMQKISFFRNKFSNDYDDTVVRGALEDIVCGSEGFGGRIGPRNLKEDASFRG